MTHASMPDDNEKPDQIYLLILGHYLHYGIYARVDQIAHPNNSLRDTDDTRCCVLGEWFHNCNYKYALGSMIVHLCSSLTPKGATCTTAVHKVDSLKLLKAGYFMVLVGGCHQC